ncbi:MAG TPA: hypothetical protein VL442_20040 [Mucilaginibacter sp.]|jgi:hypothetical protein|nr:hypothetical protein [Mucilaginibacter sp.]
MKKLLAIALLLIPFLGFSQTTKPIDGFLGIKFGSTKQQVITAIKARGGVLINGAPGANALSFSNVSLARRKSEMLRVKFVDGKAFKAGFMFKPQDDYHAIEYYNDLINDLNAVYGKGESTKKYSSPASESDQNQMGDLLVGSAEYSTYWDAADKNFIGLFIVKDDDDNLIVSLSYVDAALSDKADAQQANKDKSDL